MTQFAQGREYRSTGTSPEGGLTQQMCCLSFGDNKIGVGGGARQEKQVDEVVLHPHILGVAQAYVRNLHHSSDERKSLEELDQVARMQSLLELVDAKSNLERCCGKLLLYIVKRSRCSYDSQVPG